MVLSMAGNRCDYCGKYEMLPFTCKYCGGTYCVNHRLPEYHQCPALHAMKDGTWRPPAQARKSQQSQAHRRTRLPRIRLPAQGYYAYIIIGICVLVSILQLFAPAFFSGQMALNGQTILSKPWTIVTYMFVHSDLGSNPMHLFFNMLMLFFFGPLLERQIGSPRFLGLYVGSGILAGLAQVLLFPGSVIGASGAIMGVMGALTVLLPDLKVLVYFILPIRLVYVTALYAVLDILFLTSGDAVAHAAHLVGLAAGLVYGYLIKKNKGAPYAYWHV